MRDSDEAATSHKGQAGCGGEPCTHAVFRHSQRLPLIAWFSLRHKHEPTERNRETERESERERARERERERKTHAHTHTHPRTNARTDTHTHTHKHTPSSLSPSAFRLSFSLSLDLSFRPEQKRLNCSIGVDSPAFHAMSMLN